MCQTCIFVGTNLLPKVLTFTTFFSASLSHDFEIHVSKTLPQGLETWNTDGALTRHYPNDHPLPWLNTIIEYKTDMYLLAVYLLHHLVVLHWPLPHLHLVVLHWSLPHLHLVVLHWSLPHLHLCKSIRFLHVTYSTNNLAWHIWCKILIDFIWFVQDRCMKDTR